MRLVCGALDHRDVLFERLVEVLAPEQVAGPAPAVPGRGRGAENNACGACLELAGVRAFVVRRGPRRPEVGPGCLGWPRCSDADWKPGRAGGGLLICGGGPVRCGPPTAIARSAGARAGRGQLTDPGAALRQIDILEDAERTQLVAGWNDTAVPVPGVAGVHELVAAQAAVTPDAAAVVCGEK